MGYKSGEIYFVREAELNSAKPSNFVKIGLVAGERTSDERLSQHQTGNPRRLSNDAVIKTNAVHKVEAQLHRLYAPYRISGEWFDFSDQTVLTEAIGATHTLATEMATYVPKFESAGTLTATLSKPQILDATTEASAFAQIYVISQAKLKICRALEKEIKSKLAAAIEAGEDVQGAAKSTIVKPEPRFSVEQFQAAHKDLYEKYCIKSEKISGTIKVLFKKISRDELDEEFLDEISSIESSVAKITDLSDAYRLNLSQLALTRLASLAEWDFDLAEAELQNLCGDNEGIEGVCSWVRRPTSTSRFDRDTFANENLELWLEFTLPREFYTRLVVNKKKT